MPYKVVQTIEKGKLRLTAVPHQWEVNGVLFWPKSKHEKLRRQESSVPDPTWTTISCAVKRPNLRTFQEAEDEIDEMSDKSDTDTNVQSIRPSRNIKSVSKSFNRMAEELLENHEQSVVTPAVSDTRANSRSSFSITTENIVQSQQQSVALLQHEMETEESYVPNINMDQRPEQNVAPLSVSQPQLETLEENNLTTINMNDQSYVLLIQMQQLQEDIKTVKDDIKTIFHVQNNLLLKLSEFQTQFEGYIKLSSKSQQQDSAMNPIRSLNDFEDFEKLLSNAISKDELRKKLRVVCNKGPGKGTSNAYYLIDAIFDRTFLKECSWTGSAKGESTKICFKAFTKSIQFFFDIIHESDETFTKAACDKFFKIILRNARQRCESNQRMSSSKHRTIGKRSKGKTLATSSADHVSTHQLPAPHQPIPPDQSFASAQPPVINHPLPLNQLPAPHQPIPPRQSFASDQPPLINQSLPPNQLPAPQQPIPQHQSFASDQPPVINQSLLPNQLPAPHLLITPDQLLASDQPPPINQSLPPNQLPAPHQPIPPHQSFASDQPPLINQSLPPNQLPAPQQPIPQHQSFASDQPPVINQSLLPNQLPAPHLLITPDQLLASDQPPPINQSLPPNQLPAPHQPIPPHQSFASDQPPLINQSLPPNPLPAPHQPIPQRQSFASDQPPVINQSLLPNQLPAPHLPITPGQLLASDQPPPINQSLPPNQLPAPHQPIPPRRQSFASDQPPLINQSLPPNQPPRSDQP